MRCKLRPSELSSHRCSPKREQLKPQPNVKVSQENHKIKFTKKLINNNNKASRKASIIQIPLTQKRITVREVHGLVADDHRQPEIPLESNKTILNINNKFISCRERNEKICSPANKARWLSNGKIIRCRACCELFCG